MSSLFIEILNMSLSAGFVSLIVILIRLFLKRAPKVYSYALWAVVFFRLICPITLRLPVTAVPVQPQTISKDIIYSGNPYIQSGVPAGDHAVNTMINSSLPPAVTADSVNPVHIALTIGTYLWLAGFLALLLYSIISCLRLKRRVMTAIRIRDNIFETDLIKTPFVLGLFHPRIYIPTGLGEKLLEYVTEHERIHIRRRDYLIKPFAFCAVSLHWFNPLVWVSFLFMARDMELSADESVMKHYGSDIRGEYSNSLLMLSAKSSGLLTPLAFGETGVKERVRNVLKYKKPAFWVSIVLIAAVAAVSLLLAAGKPKETMSENPSDQVPRSKAISEASTDMQENAEAAKEAPIDAQKAPKDTQKPVYTTDYNRVSIKFIYKYQEDYPYEFETTDSKIVAYMDNTLRTLKTSSKEADLDSNNINQYTIKLSNDIGGYTCTLYYDTLYNKAYVAKDGGLYEMNTDFARYVGSFLENTDITVHIEDTEAAALFEKYGWTLDYQISAVKCKINDISSLSVFNPSAYYFAYNNELSKEIGLDMSSYSDTPDIDAEIYRIHESMPQEFYPVQNCRGITVKYNGRIIGAFISAGRHSTFNACSLKGNSFETATGQTLDGWLADRLKADSTEERFSKLEPDQVIREYFTALDNKDAKTAEYCISKNTLLGNLTVNMPNEKLFNEAIGLPLTDVDFGAKSSFDNLKSAKLISIDPFDEADKMSESLWTSVTVNLQYKRVVSIGSGEQIWGCHMVYESPQTGWKIESFGH